MRNAASELQRSDAKPRPSSARARPTLRALEQQMRGGSPRPASGPPASCSSKRSRSPTSSAASPPRPNGSGKGPSSNRDARRRLAGEKDRLADRVDAFSAACEQLAKAERRASRRAHQPAAQAKRRRSSSARRSAGGCARARSRCARAGAGARGEAQPAKSSSRASMDQRCRLLEQLERRGEGRSSQIRSRRSAIFANGSIVSSADARREARGSKGAGPRQGATPRAGRAVAGAAGPRERERSRRGAPDKRARSGCARSTRASCSARASRSAAATSAPRSGLGGTTPEQHECSQADPGTEAFKQDFSGWESLRKDVDLALERYEAGGRRRASAQQAAQDRLSAGGSDRVPDAYRQSDRAILRVAGQEEIERRDVRESSSLVGAVPGRRRPPPASPGLPTGGSPPRRRGDTR